MKEKLYSIEFTYVELGWLVSAVGLQKFHYGISHEVSKSVERKLIDVFLPLLEKINEGDNL